MPLVSFVNNGGRTGNNIFQYLAAKLIQIKYGHVYVPFKDVLEGDVVTETEYDTDLSGYHNNIICKGYFQKSAFFVPYREQLLAAIKDCDDYWFDDYGNKVMIRDFFRRSPRIVPDNHEMVNPSDHEMVNPSDHDVVISLRLDDFIQRPCPTSDILPPTYYLDILEEEMRKGGKLFIVSDILRWDWEHKYVEFFRKWSPVFFHEDLLTDFAFIRDCPTLVHSNSTFCWLASFFSERSDKRRYIPNTHFYVGQSLNKIAETDIVCDVSPLHHAEVYALNIRAYLRGFIFPLSYSVPDECVVDASYELYNNKIYDICPLIPGERSDHLFGAGEEAAYHQLYQQSWFAHTKKKGGWDCLRHHEILANGCIPIFENLKECPAHTLTAFPKPWVAGIHTDIDISTRQMLIRQLLNQVRQNGTTRASNDYVLGKLRKSPSRVLLIAGNCGVNYTREFFWIGMKRYLQSVGGVGIEYPKIEYLYDDYPADRMGELHGNGFTYTGRLPADGGSTWSESEIIEKLRDHFFDLVVYGKVGPDEGKEGSFPNFPLWEHVFMRYSRDEIVCLYGGDECINLNVDNHYREHIYLVSQYATCFVRELVGLPDA